MLSLAELREIGSIEEAEQYLAIREADSVLRDGLDKQIEYFSKRLKVDTELLANLIPNLKEITERRNIYVHNNGFVDRGYLTRVPSEVVKKYSAVKGNPLC